MATMTRDPMARRPAPDRPHVGLGLHRRALTSSALVAALLGSVSIVGLVQGHELYGADPPSVLVSEGGDTANLVVVLPVLLAATWLARRGSSTGLLLWPGALFYVTYVELVYLVAGPYSVLSFAYAATVVASATAIGVLLASIDVAAVRHRFVDVPARALGTALVVIALAAYAGLIVNGLASLEQVPVDVGFRGQWAIDMVLGTPALLAGGLLLRRRHPVGFLLAPGLFLVSALGGLAFTAAALFERLLTNVPPEMAVIGVHLAISAVSGALLALALRSGGGRGRLSHRDRTEVAP